jgi:hypothetical protein
MSASVIIDALGVGYIFTAPGKPFLGSLLMFPRFSGSFALGVGHILTSVRKLFVWPPPVLPLLSAAFGVAHNPNSVSSVRGIDTRSRNSKRLGAKADTLQVKKHLVEFHTDETSNVLTKHPSGPDFLNNSVHLRPDRTVII